MKKSLKKLIAIHGIAQVCVWLGYRDTVALKKILYTPKRKVPLRYHALIKNLEETKC